MAKVFEWNCIYARVYVQLWNLTKNDVLNTLSRTRPQLQDPKSRNFIKSCWKKQIFVSVITQEVITCCSLTCKRSFAQDNNAICSKVLLTNIHRTFYQLNLSWTQYSSRVGMQIKWLDSLYLTNASKGVVATTLMNVSCFSLEIIFHTFSLSLCVRLSSLTF